jgi:ADP-dependent NAD(P)H-hydrate dehydratase / NAD(P)H-hydrate epimerase
VSVSFWQKQTGSEPLFPDLLWSRPEQRNAAGKLLIIGGNLHAFGAPAEAFAEAEKAGAGAVRVILPDATKKTVGRILEHVEYAPSTPSGSFGQKALAELLELSAWADGVLIAGDLGRNSETAILLEKFAAKYIGLLAFTKDAADYVVASPELVRKRKPTLLVLSFAQLQKLASGLGYERAFTFDMDVLRLVDTLHDFTKQFPFFIVLKHLDQLHCAVDGQIVSTKLQQDIEIWRVKTAAYASVWWLQNPTKPLEALATALYDMQSPA